MKKIMVFLICMAALATVASGRKLIEHKDDVKSGYDFWLYVPDTVATDSIEEYCQAVMQMPDTTYVDPVHAMSSGKPLILFLHGASLCGRNLDRVLRYGTIDALDMGLDLDAFVIAPQNPGGAWNPGRLMNLIEWTERNYDIDSTRIYVLGMSLGGYGTLDMAATYPERIAAAIALCGGATVSEMTSLNELPLWIIHGMADRAVSVYESDRVVAAMKNVDGGASRLVYDRLPGVNHSQLARFFYHPGVYDWLLSHSLTDGNRAVNAALDPVTILPNAYKSYSGRSKSALNISRSRRKNAGKATRKRRRAKATQKTNRRSAKKKSAQGKP